MIEALWPGLRVEAAGPRLHKAAHYARRALGDGAGALVLRNDMVALLADGEVASTSTSSARLGEAALADGHAGRGAAALDAYGGALLPDDLYEPWAEESRESLRVLHLDLLRLAGRWEDCCARTRPTRRRTSR